MSIMGFSDNHPDSLGFARGDCALGRRSTKGRMNVDYVAARIVRSALADVDELVLAPQPIMALTYCVSVTKSLVSKIMCTYYLMSIA